MFTSGRRPGHTRSDVQTARSGVTPDSHPWRPSCPPQRRPFPLRHQLRGVAEFAYGGTDDRVVLVIDTAKVPAPVRLEASRAGAEEYPHVYGALPAAAVTGVIAVSRDAAGRLVLPG